MIHKIGLAVFDNKRILLCRKNRDTSLLIVPGGKIDPGETDEACIRREIREELDCEVAIGEFLGTYSDVAAGAEHLTVRVDLYAGTLKNEPKPMNEIAELVWFGAADDRELLSATLKNKIVPDLMERGYL
jgi:8-oxo-dGTP pyrophosphatase MutT (NUDIX family)